MTNDKYFEPSFRKLLESYELCKYFHYNPLQVKKHKLKRSKTTIKIPEIVQKTKQARKLRKAGCCL